MTELKIRSASEQVADYLKDQISRGVWTVTMPGGERLAKELGVGRMTIESALTLLEEEGLLVPQGPGRRRQIDLSNLNLTPSLRVGILLYDREDKNIYYNIDLQHRLLNAGHSARFVSKTLVDLGLNKRKITSLVANSDFDAWVISSGSHEILQWFAKHRVSAFAFAGRRRGVKISGTGPEKGDAIREVVRRLVELGHQRITMLARSVRRKPKPGKFEQIYLDELTAYGINSGTYNMPDWKETAEGLQQVLNSLFQYTPPTAIIVEEPLTFIAVEKHLAQMGILAPRDVSLICDDPDPAFTWSRPTVAHIYWDGSTVARRAVRWANNVARGKDDLRQSFIKAKFVEGGSIGTVPKKKS